MLPSPFSVKLLPGPLCWGWRRPVWQSSAIFHTSEEGAQLQVLEALLISTLNAGIKMCTGPSLGLPSTPFLLTDTSKCTHHEHFQQEIQNIGPRWHSSGQAGCYTSFTIRRNIINNSFDFFFFLNQWRTELHVTLLHNFIRSLTAKEMFFFLKQSNLSGTKRKVGIFPDSLIQTVLFDTVTMRKLHTVLHIQNQNTLDIFKLSNNDNLRNKRNSVSSRGPDILIILNKEQIKRQRATGKQKSSP